MGPLELMKFVESTVEGADEQLAALALLADAPGDDFTAPVRLPVQNELPAFKIGDGSLGSHLAELDYGVPAPVLGQPIEESQSIGDLLIGEING